MAAHAYSGPAAVLEGLPPAVGASRTVGDGANEVPSADDADAPAPDDDDDDDDDEGGVWDTASLYEEILDEVEAFEYSGNGEPARLRMRRRVWQLTTAQA
jgi:NAD-dependent histone deacetylase SIR2